MLGGSAKYRMEINIIGSLTHNGSNNVLMESRNIVPFVIEGNDIEDIFTLLGDIKEYIHAKEKSIKFPFSICLS